MERGLIEAVRIVEFQEEGGLYRSRVEDKMIAGSRWSEQVDLEEVSIEGYIRENASSLLPLQPYYPLLLLFGSRSSGPLQSKGQRRKDQSANATLRGF